MPVNIKAVPPPAKRPTQPDAGRWFIVLVIFLTIGVLISLIVRKSDDTPLLWVFVTAACFVAWLLVVLARVLYYMVNNLWADTFDRQREIVLWRLTQRGRRALQILWSEFYTEYSVSSAGTFITGSDAIKARTTWQGEQNIRHSRLPFQPGATPESTLRQIITTMMASLAQPLSRLANNTPIVLHIEANSVLPIGQIEDIVLKGWSGASICQIPEVLPGSGLQDVDKWLDERSEQQALLLVIAVQIAPDAPAEKGESVTMMLLGNHLTQKMLQPFALLRRPEASSVAELDEGITLAGDWAELSEVKPERLWLAGLSQQQKKRVTGLLNAPLLKPAAATGQIVDLDNMTGNAGCVAPWLAIAAAAQMSCESQKPQMIITGQTHETLWSTVVSPVENHSA